MPLDVTLNSKLDYQEKTVRDHIHNLVSKLEVFRDVSKRHTEKNQTLMKRRYDETAKQIGSRLEILSGFTFQRPKKDCQGNMKLWAGPYLIVQRTGPVNFRVRNLENHKLLSSPIHVNRMKFVYDRYVRSNNDIVPTNPEQRISMDNLVPEDCPEDSFMPLKAKQKSQNPIQIVPGVAQNLAPDNNVEFQVERILRGRYRNNKLQYLVKWRTFLAAKILGNL